MDYKEKYEKALERAKESLKDGGISQNSIDYIQSIFPELKESDDERIRKTLIKFHKSTIDIDGVKGSDIITWLEKQSEQKPKGYTFNAIPRLLEMIEPTDRAKSYCKKLVDSLLQEGYTTDAKIVSDCLKQMNDEKIPMATMDEQKPFDYENATIIQRDFAPQGKPKIVPKFNVGDWIVQENIGVYKVVEICNLWYEVIDFEDNHYSISYDKECMCHLWTIKDAKDGDVLAWNNSKCIAIFKSIYNEEFFDSYGFIGHYIDTFTSGYSYHNIKGVHPATKEQRDTLFARMREAGYEWDAEKKELKKQ